MILLLSNVGRLSLVGRLILGLCILLNEEASRGLNGGLNDNGLVRQSCGRYLRYVRVKVNGIERIPSVRHFIM